MTYLDFAATTPVSLEVAQVIDQALREEFGNPSSTYRLGRHAHHLLTQSREFFARYFHVNPQDVYFTSGATEANNWAIKQQARLAKNKGQGRHIVSTRIEHPSVQEVLKYMEAEEGFKVTYLNPPYTVEAFEEASLEETMGWVAMAVNNEVGSLLPVHALASRAQELGYWMHVDTVQVIGYQPFAFEAFEATSWVGSGHKFGAPKGIGFLIYKGNNTKGPLTPFIHGGGQEGGLRGGTENIPYILGMTEALKLRKASLQEIDNRMQVLRNYLLDELEKHAIPYESNGDPQMEKRAAHINSLWLKGKAASITLIQCDLNDVYISAGSACSAGSLQPSRILQAYYPQQAKRWEESIRISFGVETTEADIDQLINVLKEL